MLRFLNRLRSPSEPHIDRLMSPFQRFAAEEASGGILLLACTVAALIWANSVFEHNYEGIWDTRLTIGFRNFLVDEPVHFWINDALMAVFFFVVGLEIKRSVLLGELASFRQAALPVVAAIGGMVVPAGFYLALNAGGEGADGWAIPMSTDIAFSLGVVALLGSRVPMSLKVFLTAFAIVDDIGAVVVIAIFFTESISWVNLAVGGGLLGALVLMNIIGLRNPVVYGIVGVVVWVSFFKSGIHPTVAGILIAMTIPLKVRINPEQFVARGRALLDEFARDGDSGPRRGDLALTTVRQSSALEELEIAAREVESPLQRLEHSLHPIVAFAIMPLFALSNAGVLLGSDIIGLLTTPVSLGIMLGLVIGKPLGIGIFTWLAVKSGLAYLPEGVTWRHILGAAWLGGIGFTMSIFVTGLAFTDATLITDAKLGILVASIVAGVAGYLMLRSSTKESDVSPAEPEAT
ncbi:MAG: Na+/H+ antiporter NhaA [Chloroflexi bacterium]|nr:Na+/H+ antiporter NhaA [Chloroflexota bacterium]